MGWTYQQSLLGTGPKDMDGQSQVQVYGEFEATERWYDYSPLFGSLPRSWTTYPQCGTNVLGIEAFGYKGWASPWWSQIILSKCEYKYRGGDQQENRHFEGCQRLASFNVWVKKQWNPWSWFEKGESHGKTTSWNGKGSRWTYEFKPWSCQFIILQTNSRFGLWIFPLESPKRICGCDCAIFGEQDWIYCGFAFVHGVHSQGVIDQLPKHCIFKPVCVWSSVWQTCLEWQITLHQRGPHQWHSPLCFSHFGKWTSHETLQVHWSAVLWYSLGRALLTLETWRASSTCFGRSWMFWKPHSDCGRLWWKTHWRNIMLGVEHGREQNGTGFFVLHKQSSRCEETIVVQHLLAPRSWGWTHTACNFQDMLSFDQKPHGDEWKEEAPIPGPKSLLQKSPGARGWALRLVLPLGSPGSKCVGEDTT